MSKSTDTTTDDETAPSGEETKERLKEFSSAIEKIRDESETDDDSCGC